MGSLLGEFVSSVGCAEGENVATIEGTLLGAIEGANVGSWEGTAVGVPNG